LQADRWGKLLVTERQAQQRRQKQLQTFYNTFRETKETEAERGRTKREEQARKLKRLNVAEIIYGLRVGSVSIVSVPDLSFHDP